MQHPIKKYPVQHPLLKKYIKFFWEIQADQLQINHKIIPVRNIDLKFNLSDMPHYVCCNGESRKLENVYFSGLQDHFRNTHIRFDGKAHVLGICFLPDGFYPFCKIPIHEFKNQLLGTDEIGFRPAQTLNKRLRETADIASRLACLETELLLMLNFNDTLENFRRIFRSLKQSNESLQIADFCRHHSINMRTLERQFNQFVGVSAKNYTMLYRFQNSVNQLFHNDYDKLSDLAFDNGYFDQMHFIKEFKRFSGHTPKNFIRQNNSMLHIGKPA